MSQKKPEWPSLIDAVILELVQKQDNAVQDKVKEQLANHGYTFKTQEDFIEFCKKRISRVQIEGEPDEHEIRLDFVDVKNPGSLLIIYSTKITMEGNNIYLG